MPIAKICSLPPNFDALGDAMILDSIIELEHPELIDSSTAAERLKTSKRKPWETRKYSATLDPPIQTSHWYSDYCQIFCLWLANSNLNSNVQPKQVEDEFSLSNGFLGFLSLPDRPYLLIVFESPESALLTWKSKNRTYGESIGKEVLLEFATNPLPPSYALIYHSKFGTPSSSSDSMARPVPLDDWRDIPGLCLIPNFLDESQERRLIEVLLGPEYVDEMNIRLTEAHEDEFEEKESPEEVKIERTSTSTPSSNWIALTKRRVQHYGYAFNYLTKNVDPSQFLGPLPEFAEEVVATLNDLLVSPKEADVYAPEHDQIRSALKGEKWKPDQLTINEYRPGQGIPHHIDTHSAFEEIIVSVSILGDTVMEFCHPEGKKGRKKVLIPKRSLIALTGDARFLWTHGITPRTTDQIHGKASLRRTRISLTFRNVKAVPSCDCHFPPQCDLWRSGLRSHQSKIETLHVHDVYDRIAPHFDKTRYKPWPKLVSFLNDLRSCEGSPLPLVCDVGCGNGRYMGNDIYEMMSPNHGLASNSADLSSSYFELLRVGGDRSYNLASICQKKGYNVVQFDCLKLPYRSNLFDATLCIAVLHHLSTTAHRVQAIEELLRVTKINGRIAIFVWALIQNNHVIDANDHHHSSEKPSSRSFGQQDIFVPWTIESKSSGVEIDGAAEQLTLQRYLHVYRNRELAELVDIINSGEKKATILEEGVDHGNCYIILQRC